MSSLGSELRKLRRNRVEQHSRAALWLWYAFGISILLVVLFFIGLSFSNLPDTKELENPKSQLASEIYDVNGEVLGRFYIENRVPVSFDELSPHLVQALLATEDERYYRHSGIDLEALGRVAVRTALLRQSGGGGGSTITQQLAKLLFTIDPSSNFVERAIQKLKEWIIAVRLERRYTKEEIIAMYLNKMDFIYNGDGIKAASEVYFGKGQDSLLIEEAALLIGMLKNPVTFNPIINPNNATRRREVVLKQMQKAEILTQAEYDSLRQLPLNVTLRRAGHNDGLAAYARGEMSKVITTILQREESRKPDGTAYNAYRDGLRIYTSIDSRVQVHMEASMIEHMSALQKTFWKHWEKLSPWTYKDAQTTPAELKARERKLQRMIQESDRYKAMMDQYLGEVRTEIEDVLTGFTLRPVDIERMLSEEENSGVFDRLKKDNYISEDMASNYRKIMRSKRWGKLKKQWAELQKAVEKAFDQPVPMKVFTFENAQFEKDTVMSPLDSLKYHHSFLQIGALAVEPTTGYIRGWVGGINYRYFKFDHIHSRRQVGSTFKPFIYATAIAQQGISPCFQVYDRPQTIYPNEGNFQVLEPWTPANSTGKYSGELINLKDALRNSVNTVSVYLLKQLNDVEPVRELIDNMGISKDAKYPNGRYIVPQAPSICLGATDLSVYEMTGAYTTFANNGVYSKPVVILKIEDRNGRVIYRAEEEDRMALNERANYAMVNMLQHSGNMGGIVSEFGGKTGTTNDHVDGWFMGITPGLVVGTWVGGTDRWIRFRQLDLGQGSRLAKPFCRKLLQRLEADPDSGYDPKLRFHVPPGDLGIELDCSRYRSVSGNGDEFNELPGLGEDPFGDDLPPIRRDSEFNE
jgi:penicillin-binding protein 1A